LQSYIIIDTPPILPFAETQIISMLVDGVLLVVKEGVTTGQDMRDPRSPEGNAGAGDRIQ